MTDPSLHSQASPGAFEILQIIEDAKRGDANTTWREVALQITGVLDRVSRERTRRALERAQRAEDLLRRIAGWDHMDGAQDGAYWRNEIAAVLEAK